MRHQERINHGTNLLNSTQASNGRDGDSTGGGWKIFATRLCRDARVRRWLRFTRLGVISWLAILTPQGKAGPKSIPYTAVCTTGMVGDIVRNIASDQANVETLIGEGVDPHLYQATRSDIAKLLNADIVFYNGLVLEGKMADSLIRVGRSRPVYAVSELIEESHLLSPPEFAGHFDPHLWMDVSLWKRCAEMVARTLGEFDPPHASLYRARYESYQKRLHELDAYARRVLATIPARSRVLVTAHDAFNYLARAYGLEVRGIQGISTESEAGLDDINRLVDLLVERNIRAVFVETSVSEKNVRSLIEGAASRNHEVVIGGKLFSDAMGAGGTYEGTYVGMIDHNVTTITRALGGQAPDRGMSGQLTEERRP